MIERRAILGLSAMAVLAACSRGGDAPATRYDGPAVTSLQVFKGRRALYLLHEGEVLRRYRIDLGFQPEGPKRYEGDGRTPEGDYVIDRRNPRSAYYLSLGISYPNRAVVAAARAAGRAPGGDIFIHGRRPIRSGRPDPDWTAGCIAVDNRAMREIYRMVPIGTPIRITA